MGEKGAEAGAYRLGSGAAWPSWGGSAGAQTVRNNPTEPALAGSQGTADTPGMYLPFTTEIPTGSRDDAMQPAVDEVNDGTVFEPARIPFVAGSRASGAAGERGAEAGSSVSALEPFSYDTALVGWDEPTGTPRDG
jgi:hypothetical protein